MYDRNLSWIDDRFSVKSHQVDILYILTEAIHIIQIGINGIKALYACGSCCDYHILSCSHELDSGSCDMCLKVFGVISTGKCDTEHSVRSLTDFQGMHHTSCRFDC